MSKLERAITAAERIEGWMTHDELVWLAYQAKRSDLIVEIGSWHGRSTKVMAMMTPGVVVSVDSLTFDEQGYGNEPQDQAFRRNLAPEIKRGKVKTIRKPSVKAAASFRGKASMIFIDGAHEKPDVMADLEAWTPKLSQGGILCGHDLTYPGVREALDEFGLSYTEAVEAGGHDANGIPIGSIWVAA